MADSSLPVRDRELFLAEPHVAALSALSGACRRTRFRPYIEFVRELGEQVAIYLRPERWLTADLGPGDIPPGVSAMASGQQPRPIRI